MGKLVSQMTPEQREKKRQYDLSYRAKERDRLRQRDADYRAKEETRERDTAYRMQNPRRQYFAKLRAMKRDQMPMPNPDFRITFTEEMTAAMILGVQQNRNREFLAAEIGVGDCRLYKELASVGLSKAKLKLSDYDVETIRRLASNGTKNQESIAKMFDIDPSHVSRIVRGLSRTSNGV